MKIEVLTQFSSNKFYCYPHITRHILNQHSRSLSGAQLSGVHINFKVNKFSKIITKSTFWIPAVCKIYPEGTIIHGCSFAATSKTTLLTIIIGWNKYGKYISRYAHIFILFKKICSENLAWLICVSFHICM